MADGAFDEGVRVVHRCGGDDEQGHPVAAVVEFDTDDQRIVDLVELIHDVVDFAAADAHGLSMVFTGRRHFRH